VVAAVIAGSLLVPGQWSQAETFYVDVCAPGPGTGSQANPFNTLERAVAAAAATAGSDNTIMKGGVYPETLTIDTAVTITATDGSALIGTGKYNVGWYDEPNLSFTKYGESPPDDTVYTTAARVYYPIACEGGEENFPVVVYAHGRAFSERDICDGWNTGPPSGDYTQLSGILNRLAASGIIAISFDWITPSSDTHRDDLYIDGLFQGSIDYLSEQNQTSGSVLEGIVDIQRVGLSGHSTGGYHAWYMASELPDIKAVGLIAPGIPIRTTYSSSPLLVIHGTNDHPAQVGTQPLGIYCMSNGPKHLVTVSGANHFGYTDGICLDPEGSMNLSSPCTQWERSQDPWCIQPASPGKDNPSFVGGLTQSESHEAHARQQRTAGNYLLAFFSYYLRTDPPYDDDDVPGYLVQETGEQCGHLNDELQCRGVKELDVYMWWPNVPDPDDLCPSVQVDILSGGGRGVPPTVIGTVPVYQRLNGGQWNHLGRWPFTSRAVVRMDVIRNSPGDCSVVADAVKFVNSPGSPPSAAEERIFEASLTNSPGDWTESTEGGEWYGENYLVSSADGDFSLIGNPFSFEIDTSDCDPNLPFDDLQSLNVGVKVCSCLDVE
jgi:dienelactone hydrolase